MTLSFAQTLGLFEDIVIEFYFDLKPPRNDTLMEEIKILSHSWICHRNKSLSPTWLAWLTDPVLQCFIFFLDNFLIKFMLLKKIYI